MAVVVVCCSKRRELDNRHKTGRLASFGWLHLDFRLCMQGSGPKVNRSTHHFWIMCCWFFFSTDRDCDKMDFMRLRGYT